MEDEWTVSATDALAISLVRLEGDDLVKISTFPPEFTYALFGDEEQIFGYKGLKLNLVFNASDMRPHMSMSSSRKFKPVDEIQPDDVVGSLKEFLPPVAFQKKQDFIAAAKQIPDDWTPPGQLIKTVQRGEDNYEIWRGSLADAGVRQLLRRIQILVPLYIEGGTYIAQDDEGNDEPDHALARWSVFFIYRKGVAGGGDKHQYTFQGFATVYHFWKYEPVTPPASPGKENGEWELPGAEVPFEEMPHRARISQFIILPPFQGNGAGAILYNAIYEHHIKDASTKEITVEDPNEAFDRLRDLCDMSYLRQKVVEFAGLRLNTAVCVPARGGTLHHSTKISLSKEGEGKSEKGIVDRDALEALRVRVKMAPRQFARLVEMQLMSKLPDAVQPKPLTDAASVAARASKASAAERDVLTLWRLLLKQRLYYRNVSVLGEFDLEQRIHRLDETVEGVQWEYAERLERLRRSALPPSKRGLDGNGDGGGEEGRSHKKARTGDEDAEEEVL